MATIHISGLPGHCKLPKVVFSFKNILRREGILKFWIREMSDIRGTDLKSANVEFKNNDEAYRALTVLDGFLFDTYPLTASLEDSRMPRRRSPSPSYRSRGRTYRDDYAEPRRRYGGYGRERSRSPVSYEASKLDLEIELLKKQRMIIEEERRILLERKKLEMVKEFGPSAINELRDFEEDHDRRERRYRAERRRRRTPSPPPPPRARFPAPARPPPPKKPRNQLPQFLLPCKLIFAELNEHIDKLSTKKENFLLTKLIRSTLRKRLAVALEGQPIMSGAKIAALYREKYPKTLDEDFVKKHLKDLRACHLHLKEDHEEKNNEKNKAGDEEKQETKENADAGNTNNDKANMKTDTENGFTSGVLIKEEQKSMEETEDVPDKTKEVPDETKEDPDGTKDVQNETEVKQNGNDDLNLKIKEEQVPIEGNDVQDGTNDVQDETEVEKTGSADSAEATEAVNSHDNNEEEWGEGGIGWDDVDKEKQT